MYHIGFELITENDNVMDYEKQNMRGEIKP